jgi:hypothetical protein
MKKTIPILCIISLFTCCKKKNDNPYSFWTVNGKNFKTNDVSIAKNPVVFDWGTTSIKNGFSFSFSYGRYQTGRISLGCSTHDPAYGCFGIVYNDTGYGAKYNDGYYMQASMVNNRMQYVLDSTWLYDGIGDSVLVYGTFNEP